MRAERSGPTGPWEAFGSYLKSQRQLAQLSLRQLADLTRISNPYLSQIERGLHQPSISVVKSLAEALNVSVDQLLAHAAGVVAATSPSTEAAIRADPRLSDQQRAALLAVYRSMVGGDEGHGATQREPSDQATAATPAGERPSGDSRAAGAAEGRPGPARRRQPKSSRTRATAGAPSSSGRASGTTSRRRTSTDPTSRA